MLYAACLRLLYVTLSIQLLAAVVWTECAKWLGWSCRFPDSDGAVHSGWGLDQLVSIANEGHWQHGMAQVRAAVLWACCMRPRMDQHVLQRR